MSNEPEPTPISVPYQQPRLRVLATYPTSSDRGPEAVEVEIHDESVPISSTFIAQVVAALAQVTTVRATTSGAYRRLPANGGAPEGVSTS